jgi:DNA-binding response OmpR family regulator
VTLPAYPFWGEADSPHTSAPKIDSAFRPIVRDGFSSTTNGDEDMRTILVIEDHLPTLITLCLILNGNGYRALQAQNAAEAESIFRDNPIDMLLVDHGLPGLSGSDIAGRLKHIRAVLVVMLSGNPELKSKPADVDLLLAKPQQVPELLVALETLFASHHLNN